MCVSSDLAEFNYTNTHVKTEVNMIFLISIALPTYIHLVLHNKLVMHEKPGNKVSKFRMSLIHALIIVHPIYDMMCYELISFI